MTALFRPAVLSLALLLGCAGLRPAAAEQFTPAQRAEIVRILRDALTQDPSILRDAVAALQAEESKRQAASVLAHAASLIDPADPVAGNPKGDVTIVEFFDTRCPFCRRLEPAMAGLLAQDHGVRLVYKDLPILGPASVLGSRALLAAQRQGGYEALRTAIMHAPPDTTEATVREAAQKTGLDWPRLQRDMADPAIDRRLTANLHLARELGIDGTPALVIGRQFIPGAVDLAELQKAVGAARDRAEAPGR